MQIYTFFILFHFILLFPLMKIFKAKECYPTTHYLQVVMSALLTATILFVLDLCQIWLVSDLIKALFIDEFPPQTPSGCSFEVPHVSNWGRGNCLTVHTLDEF